MKTWKLTVSEDELIALIAHHSSEHWKASDKERAHIFGIEKLQTLNTERSARIHDLTKRLNKETPEIETEIKNNNEAQQEVSKDMTASEQTWS